MSLGPRAIQFLLHEKVNSASEMPRLPACPEYHFQVEKEHRRKGLGGKLVELFISGLTGGDYKEIGAQVTVCDGQVPLAYYERMSVQSKPLWRIYDRRESAIYSADEKEAWGLGTVVENVSLVADKTRLLAFVRPGPLGNFRKIPYQPACLFARLPRCGKGYIAQPCAPSTPCRQRKIRCILALRFSVNRPKKQR